MRARAHAPPGRKTNLWRPTTGNYYADIGITGRTRKNLTEKQQVKLAWIVQTDPRLGRAYYLKEGLRVIFKLPYDQAAEALDRRVARARR